MKAELMQDEVQCRDGRVYVSGSYKISIRIDSNCKLSRGIPKVRIRG